MQQPLLYILGERVLVLAHGEACVSRARVVDRADATSGAWVVSADDGTRAVWRTICELEEVGNASAAMGVVIVVAHDDEWPPTYVVRAVSAFRLGDGREVDAPRESVRSIDAIVDRCAVSVQEPGVCGIHHDVVARASGVAGRVLAPRYNCLSVPPQ